MKVSLVKALLNQRCPKCREGLMFKTSALNFHFMEMNEHCPRCSVILQPEPGFYQGAMYVGYAFSVAIVVAVSLLVMLIEIKSPWISIAIVSIITILLVPFNFRYSRVLFLYMFGGIKYQNPA